MEKEENFECQQNHEENSKTKGALQSWGEDLSVDHGAVPRAKVPPARGLA